MGSLLSLPISKTQDGELSELSQNDAYKRQRMSSSYYDENLRLIHTLLDDISLQILAGTKLSVVVNGELYALDPCSSLASGDIKRYDHQEDVWNVVIQRVPVHDFTDYESPYLLAGFLGKLYVITKDDDNRVAILQADLQKHKQSSPSTSSAPSADFRPGNPISIVDEETDIWKIIASKNFGAAELVSCQVLGV